MKNIVPEFVIGADNVYRTKNYIIKQVIFLDKSLSENNSITSFDTFYLRNRKRDCQYESVFADKSNINGKRLPSTMCSRKYVK